MTQLPQLSDARIIAARGPRNSLDVWRPWHFLSEPEYSAAGVVEDVATIFLTNRECPFRCLMCDLWKNTTESSVPPGAIAQQIRYALQRLDKTGTIKLYNSGNFFDAQAIRSNELPDIAALLNDFHTVIVENHPKLCDRRCVQFAEQISGRLEIAMGLETSDRKTLKALNKQMTVEDFRRACDFLIAHDVSVRTFILLRPPGTSEEQGIRQALDSIRFAFNCRAGCCAVIPTRAGNGILDELQAAGQFTPPRLSSLESVMENALQWKAGRVFADLWDARQFGRCTDCTDKRLQRLQQMNFTQKNLPAVHCNTCRGAC